jgi:hypothetical protein
MRGQYDALSAMAPTSRFTGIGRLKTILDDMACCRMKLLLLFEYAKMAAVAQEIPQYTRVRCQSCDRDSNMIIYTVHFLLV